MTPTERDDLNKRIAEDLEPMPEVPTDLMNRSICGTKYWHFVYGVNEWRANDIITDPACTLLLMRKILETGRDLTINTSGENLVNLSSDYIELKDVIRIQFKPIGEAVAMAYLAMRGLK